MNETPKKLMNEQLPTPVISPRGSPRDRVWRHMRDALAAGASVALLSGCPFAVVDPLPPAALCRSQGADKLLTATVAKADVDGGPPDFVVTLAYKENAGLLLDGTNVKVTNGTLVSFDETHIRVTPASVGLDVDVVIAAKCDDGRSAARSLGVRVRVNPTQVTVTVAEVAAP